MPSNQTLLYFAGAIIVIISLPLFVAITAGEWTINGRDVGIIFRAFSAFLPLSFVAYGGTCMYAVLSGRS